MAETINLKKRLICKEDISFDVSGTMESDRFFTPEGVEKTLTKVSAAHFPLTTEARRLVGTTNVDDAIVAITERVNNFSTAEFMTEDITIEFQVSDDAETIQNTINQQKKNLNGHTLTFVFPVLLQQNLYASFLLQDFFNGTIVIGGGSSANKISFYDRLDITSLFRIYRCQCEVIVQNCNFVHQYSLYGISAVSTASVIVRNCSFSGIVGEDSYAVNKVASNVSLLDCEVSDDEEFYPSDSADGMGKSVGEVFAFVGRTPPAGSYLLNGQTIYGCRELYPQFWEFVNNSGVRVVASNTYTKELQETGVCGGFVADIVTGNIRLPSITAGTLWGGDGISVGKSLAAGLPNITGSFFSIWQTSTDYYSEAFQTNNQYVNGMDYQDSPTRTSPATFDASRSNPIYGKSDTVQPPAIRVCWCIQVFNTATKLSSQESAQLASAIQTKLETDLSNLPADYDFVVASNYTEYDDGSTMWYRRYHSGWVEQGGSLSSDGEEVSLLFPVEFKDRKFEFTVGLTTLSGNGNCTLNKLREIFGVRGNVEEGDVIIRNHGQSWLACGMAATE